MHSERTVAIVGSGAIGCYYGALLARAGRHVSFLMRSGLREVRENGLHVKTPSTAFVLRNIEVMDTPEKIGPCDLVIVALKASGNHLLPTLVPPLLKPDTRILTLQNGLGSDEQLAELFGAERVFGGLCFVCVNRTAPNQIHCSEPGYIALGEFGRPPSRHVHEISEMLTHAGVSCRVGESLEELRWRKLVWNVPFNGLSIAAGGITTDQILAEAFLESLVRALMSEVIGAAKKLGHHIPQTFIDEQIEHTRRMGAYRPSSLIDFLAGREVEVEPIWGEPLRRANNAGAETPRLDMLYALLRQLTSSLNKNASLKREA